MSFIVSDREVVKLAFSQALFDLVVDIFDEPQGLLVFVDKSQGVSLRANFIIGHPTSAL